MIFVCFLSLSSKLTSLHLNYHYNLCHKGFDFILDYDYELSLFLSLTIQVRERRCGTSEKNISMFQNAQYIFCAMLKLVQLWLVVLDISQNWQKAEKHLQLGFYQNCKSRPGKTSCKVCQEFCWGMMVLVSVMVIGKGS